VRPTQATRDSPIQGCPEGFPQAIAYGIHSENLRLWQAATVGRIAERVPPLEMDFIVDYHTVGGTGSLFKWKRGRHSFAPPFNAQGPGVRPNAAFCHGTR
jgi:hypothetical protein